MLDNELESILTELNKNEHSNVPKDQNKFKTSDFSLDSILKEYGIDDSRPKKSKVETKVKQTIPTYTPITKKEFAPAKVEQSKEIDNARKELFAAIDASTTKVSAPKKEDIIQSKEAVKEEAKEVSSPVETTIKEPEYPVIIDDVDKKEITSEINIIDKAIDNVVETPEVIQETEKITVNESKVELDNQVDVDKTAEEELTKTETKDGNVDLFNNSDIMSALAANKLGTTQDESEEKKEITRMFTPEQEEDFKMRSGYIDLEAIKAATTAINLADKEEAEDETILQIEPNMDSHQKMLFGKIGSFFSDTTFKYDTSYISDTKEISKTNNKNKNNTDDENIEQPEITPLDDDIFEQSDVARVEQDLLSQVNLAFLKIILTAILSLPLAILNLAPNFLENALPSLAPSSPFNYGVANLAILLIIAIINISVVGKGILGLISFKPTGSSLASLTVISALIHSIFTMIVPSENPMMFGYVAALSIIFILIGKYIYFRNVYKNFEILAFNSPKTACVNNESGYSLKDLYTDGKKSTACRPVDLLTHFLTNSFDSNFADKISKYVILIAVSIAVFLSIIVGLTNNSISAGIGALSASFALICPFCYDISYSLPFNMVSNKIRKTGSAVVSYSVAKEFEKTDRLIMCDTDLFRPEDIVVHSMKINGNEKINDVIINCASLIAASNSPVAGAFLNILDNKNEMLMPVNDFDWATGKGYSGEINGTRYYIGTSQYLADCGIKLPTIDLEEKYKRIGRQVVMFADSRKLLAVFSISYSYEKLIYKNLHKISLNGMKILVLTKDSNITPALIASTYEMDESIFRIASKEEYERMYHNNKPLEKCPAKIYSITGASGITSALSNCGRLISTLKISVLFRTLAISASVFLLIYAVLSNNVSELLSAKNAILYNLLWIFPSIFVSLFAG